MTFQQKILNNNLPKEDDKPSEEDYRRYNEYLELLKRQEEESKLNKKLKMELKMILIVI